MSRYNSLSLFNAAQLFPDLLSRLLCTCWETISPLLIQPTGLSPVSSRLLSLSLPFFLSVWLCSLVRLLVLVLSWQVSEIEFYKANKHENPHREKEALIELSNTNLPRDSVWQKLIRSTACLCLRDCLTASNCLSLWLSCNLSVISATIITRISGCFHGPWTNI